MVLILDCTLESSAFPKLDLQERNPGRHQCSLKLAGELSPMQPMLRNTELEGYGFKNTFLKTVVVIMSSLKAKNKISFLYP